MIRRYCSKDHWFPCQGLFLASLFALAVLVMALGGCTPTAFNRAGEGATAGGANYQIDCRPDGTSTISVNSGREVHGVTVMVDGRNCTLEAVVEDLHAITVSNEFLLDLMRR